MDDAHIPCVPVVALIGCCSAGERASQPFFAAVKPDDPSEQATAMAVPAALLRQKPAVSLEDVISAIAGAQNLQSVFAFLTVHYGLMHGMYC